MSRWKILRTSVEWEPHYSLMRVLFPALDAFCAPPSEPCQQGAATLMRAETDPGLVTTFTCTLCTFQRKHPIKMRTRKPSPCWCKQTLRTIRPHHVLVPSFQFSFLSLSFKKRIKSKVGTTWKRRLGVLCKTRCWKRMKDLCNVIL